MWGLRGYEGFERFEGLLTSLRARGARSEGLRGVAYLDLVLPPKQVFCPRCSGDRGGAEDRGGLVSDYDRFHNMNLLAEQICAMDVARTELSFRVIGE